MKNEVENKLSLEDFNMEDFIGNSIANSSSKGASLVVPNKKNRPSNGADIREVSQEITSTIEAAETVNVATPKLSKKTMTSKQRKTSLQEYQQSFLIVPKITDRKTVFISNELRERIVSIVRKLGTEKSRDRKSTRLNSSH